jgi:hypothetical protein
MGCEVAFTPAFFAVTTGIIGAMLAVVFQKFAIGLVGFAAGGYIAINLLTIVGLQLGYFVWLPYIINNSNHARENKMEGINGKKCWLQAVVQASVRESRCDLRKLVQTSLFVDGGLVLYPDFKEAWTS